MVRAVRFSRFGGPSVLAYEPVDDVATPAGRIRVRVEAAGLNVYDTKRREGREGDVRFPAGNGSEFAGVVEELGEGATGFSAGQPVLGRAYFRSQADAVRVKPEEIVARPAALPVEVAGGLDVAGRTAAELVRFAGIGPADTVLVSAAAGGVGSVVVQLARLAGATVLGTAGDRNADFLESVGVLRVPYGPELAERVRRAAPGPVTAVLDLHGRETIEAGLALGVAPSRIVTLADRPAAEELGTAALPSGPADSADLARVASLVAAGEVVLPIDRVFPVEDVVAAYEHFEGRHLRGKVVLRF
ncbi:NADP-dependent oxidoreductase [Naasia aerilata]|uniref:NADPH:quinone reductase n=1 Tax=Naasia aerilata TaxID=1162966 RepID=A0ABM8GH22_9MICO|nr:NADP-dependent oxidoreductase [Naasia aerilata]BDZ47660.1 NADPH:quinone reductase [Naasia aerilata]